MTTSEIRKLTAIEIIEELKKAVLEYQKLKISLKSNAIAPEIINKSRLLKKDIARLKTVLSELSLIETIENGK